MDEGGWESGSKSVRISTNKITLQEVELLRDIFKAKFNLDCTIPNQKRISLNLRINILFILKYPLYLD